jgi:propanol-preferring alcohol dehydrogenase
MGSTMKAWQFTHTHNPLARVDLPVPQPGPGKVLVAVKAVGICHSDVGLFEDEKWLNMLNLPIVPGHEIAGEIVSVAINGGFGEYVVALADGLVRVPDSVSLELAVFAEPGMTAHAAVVTAGQVSAGQKVGIIGFGGLGQIAVRVAALSGAHVFVADLNPDVWDRAREAGAERVVRDVSELVDEELDVIVDFAGFGTTTAAAITTVGQGGRVVQVGMGRLEATIDTYALMTKAITLIGVVGGGKDDMDAVLGWMASGDIQPVYEQISFDEIPAGIGRVRDGDVRGRLMAAY